MGNCFTLLRPTIKRCIQTSQDRILQIIKTDGKILQYEVPILVKDLLLNFDDHFIGTSIKSTQHLPLDYELRLGQTFYLLPKKEEKTVLNSAEDDYSGSSKRIKVVITKQQLQELLTKKISVEDVISDLQKGAMETLDSSMTTGWRPQLETIPEGNE